MEKILDKILPPTAARSIKLHQKYDWLKTEGEFLPAKYEAKKEKTKNRFIYKANKKLSSAAYLVCDKVEYADSVMAEKLRKFDISNYMRHRAANHKAAKAIFSSIKSGEDWTIALDCLKVDNLKLREKRHEYLTKLRRARVEFIMEEKNKLTRGAAKVIMKELVAEKGDGGYFEKMRKINEELSSADESYTKKLRNKCDTLVAKAVKIMRRRIRAFPHLLSISIR